MVLRKHYSVAILTIMLLILLGWGTLAAAGELFSGTLEHNGHVRTYDYYVPSGYDGSKAVPLVFSFHGLGSNSKGQRALTQFDWVAEEHGLIVVFPNALVLQGEHPRLPALPGANIQWNIGLDMSLQYAQRIDDVGFVSALIDKLSDKYKIDQARVYATGMSNGAMFSYRLALELPDKITAIAAVTAPMTVNFAEAEASRPLTVIIMMGDEDPIVPYKGRDGVFLSINDTVAYWVEANGIAGDAEVTYLPQTAADDPTRIKRTLYSGGENSTEVILYTIEGGGHTWPGGHQYFPPEAIGIVSRHINGSEVIWEHLRNHALPAERMFETWIFYLLIGVLLLVIAVVVTAVVRKRVVKKA